VKWEAIAEGVKGFYLLERKIPNHDVTWVLSYDAGSHRSNIGNMCY